MLTILSIIIHSFALDYPCFFFLNFFQDLFFRFVFPNHIYSSRREIRERILPGAGLSLFWIWDFTLLDQILNLMLQAFAVVCVMSPGLMELTICLLIKGRG